MSFGKRQIILASLVVALGAAVYLNWQFSSNPNFLETIGISKGKELGEAQYVNKQVEEQPQDAKSGEEKPQNADEYFSKAKVSRQKSRDEITEMVKGVLSDVNSDENAKQEAIKQAAGIAKNIQQESNIENLLKAKGFDKCLVFINNDECSVVVAPGKLQAESAIVIKDIVSGQGSITLHKVKIIEAK